MLITINQKSDKSIYEQIIWQVEQQAYLGVLGKDQRLPSVRELALAISVNPNTVAKAYTYLEERGVIYSVKGRGTFVSGGGRLPSAKERGRAEQLVEEAALSLLFSGEKPAAVRQRVLKITNQVIAQNHGRRTGGQGPAAKEQNVRN
jgi:GntR family transcriptional regulator